LSRPAPPVLASRSPLATFAPQAPAAPPLLVLLTSLGGYTGDVMQMRVINGTGRPLSLAGETFAMEPLKKDAADDARKAFEREEKVAGKPAPLLRVNAYCLEFLKHPPEAGMVFRLADAGAQERFRPMRRSLAASRRLDETGQLKPDMNRRDYLHSVRQWAVWTREQGFTEESFGKAFLEQSK